MNLFGTLAHTTICLLSCKDSNGQVLHSFESEILSRGAVSDEFIVLSTKDNIIDVHQVRDGYNLLRTIHLSICHDVEFFSSVISFLNAQTVMVATSNAGIFFVSLE